MDTKNPRAGSCARASVSFASDTRSPNKLSPKSQPDSVHQLRALRLISSHHVRPSLALALAGLVFGEVR